VTLSSLLFVHCRGPERGSLSLPEGRVFLCEELASHTLWLTFSGVGTHIDPVPLTGPVIQRKSPLEFEVAGEGLVVVFDTNERAEMFALCADSFERVVQLRTLASAGRMQEVTYVTQATEDILRKGIIMTKLTFRTGRSERRHVWVDLTCTCCL